MMHPAKRRRINANASTLSQPFRSPLKLNSNRQSRDSTTGQARVADQQSPNESIPRPSYAITASKASAASTRAVADVDNDDDNDRDVTALQKEHVLLSQQLRKLRQDLDAAEQALKIRSTGQEDKLNKLISKWRTVARDAADEVFATASSRVKNMGGLQTWQTKSAQDRFRDWYDAKGEQPSSDATDTFAEEEVWGDADQGLAAAIQAKYNGDEADVRFVANSRQDVGHANEIQQQSFTMAVMLRQFNIDPHLLGFDEKNEQWIE